MGTTLLMQHTLSFISMVILTTTKNYSFIDKKDRLLLCATYIWKSKPYLNFILFKFYVTVVFHISVLFETNAFMERYLHKDIMLEKSIIIQVIMLLLYQ